MKLRTALLLIVMSVLAGCETVQTTQPGAVGVNRQQHMAISEQEFNQGAAKSYAQLMQQARAKGVLNRDGAQLARVREIGRAHV